jgi:DNA invertase Pin-like site-specific DNA recombinase
MDDVVADALIPVYIQTTGAAAPGGDTTTAMGRAMLGVAVASAPLAGEMIAENVCDGLARRAGAGKWNGPKWNPPLGYTYSVRRGEVLPNSSPVPRRPTLLRRFDNRRAKRSKYCLG